jgi:hypothetical protein
MKNAKLTLWLVFGGVLVLLVSSTAAAQGQGAPPAAGAGGTVGEEGGSGDTVIYKKTTIIDFSDVTITGELTKPEGSYLMNKKKAQFNLLINVRDNFLPEMIKTVDNL